MCEAGKGETSTVEKNILSVRQAANTFSATSFPFEG